jgi:hypothetical protein
MQPNIWPQIMHFRPILDHRLSLITVSASMWAFLRTEYAFAVPEAGGVLRLIRVLHPDGLVRSGVVVMLYDKGEDDRRKEYPVERFRKELNDMIHQLPSFSKYSQERPFDKFIGKKGHGL